MVLTEVGVSEFIFNYYFFVYFLKKYHLYIL